ncbi:hypothetical protein [Tomitella fengzijianii]|uniref:Uncharacterized protein n=1 Tax=Tomitella fengzijianii TaxID=2597660 RepID=A0A516X4W3_9ACTN|nr:hypothetical protein [Tomitella fengzijianii]QDQ98106.1 hypothetical protein FO059_13280 [Tomitella fengzijianii]
MTSTDTAAIQSLAAEVRVLQIGNRQITQSVAKQLDTARPQDLEPFGRVRLTGKDFDELDWIIGRHPNGDLRIAHYNKLPRQMEHPGLSRWKVPVHAWRDDPQHPAAALIHSVWTDWSVEIPQYTRDAVELKSPEGHRIAIPQTWCTIHRPLGEFELSRAVSNSETDGRGEVDYAAAVKAERYDACLAQGQEEAHDLAIRILDMRARDIRFRQKLEALPLIVLAGLR